MSSLGALFYDRWYLFNSSYNFSSSNNIETEIIPCKTIAPPPMPGSWVLDFNSYKEIKNIISAVNFITPVMTQYIPVLLNLKHRKNLLHDSEFESRILCRNIWFVGTNRKIRYATRFDACILPEEFHICKSCGSKLVPYLPCIHCGWVKGYFNKIWFGILKEENKYIITGISERCTKLAALRDILTQTERNISETNWKSDQIAQRLEIKSIGQAKIVNNLSSWTLKTVGDRVRFMDKFSNHFLKGIIRKNPELGWMLSDSWTKEITERR